MSRPLQRFLHRLIIAGLALALLLGGMYLVMPPRPAAYWIWAGVTAQDAPEKARLYLYQGLFLSENGSVRFLRKGLYPYPLKAPEVYLVFRLDGGLVQNLLVPETVMNCVHAWETRGTPIAGVQLDVDTPTSQLLQYGTYLDWVRRALPPSYRLSITGLGDWLLWGDRTALTHIGGSVDEIVIQLYQGRKSFADSGRYLARLWNFPFPFRIGVLPDNPYLSSISIFILRLNPLFKGWVYFIQKPS